MKIASVKKNSPSNANGIPNASPHLPMNFGHSRPNSKVSTVPVTAPTAKVTAMYLDQRHRRPRHAERHEDDVHPERERHLGPRPRQGVHGEDRRREIEHGTLLLG